MPRRKHVLTVAVVVSLVAAGCAGPTPRDQEVAQAGRQQVEGLLNFFAQAVRQRDPSLIRPLLSPLLKPGEAHELEAHLLQASWLVRYSGYALDARRAVSETSWRAWKGPELRLNVSGSAAFGRTFEQEFTLVRTDGEWRIRSFEMGEPKPDEPLDPPPEVRHQLEPKARQMVEDLKEGRIASVIYTMPNQQACRYRSPTLSWWQRLVPSTVAGIAVVSDLETMRQFSVSAWPDPQAPVEVVYDSPHTIAVLYKLPYLWLEGGVSEPDVLRVKLIFSSTREGWAFYTIRLSGKGIPYS